MRSWKSLKEKHFKFTNELWRIKVADYSLGMHGSGVICNSLVRAWVKSKIHQHPHAHIRAFHTANLMLIPMNIMDECSK